jgi:predicted Na+-dependent transporter
LLSLIVFQLLPLLGLLALNERAPSVAARLRGPSVRLATVLLVLVVVAVAVDFADELIGLGALPIVGMTALVVLGLGFGYLLGGRSAPTRRTVALITGQRSSATALLAVQSLAISGATAAVVGFGLCMLVVNLGTAVAIRRRSGQAHLIGEASPAHPAPEAAPISMHSGSASTGP